MRRRRPHIRHLRRLQVRLLLSFLAAIVLAIGASVLTTVLTAEDQSDVPSRVVSRHVQGRVAKLWDDPPAADAYVAELRDTTGLDIRLSRDPSMFGRQRVRPGGMVFENGVAYLPVVRHGETVGALEIRTGAKPPRPWRVVLALAAALLALGLVARRMSHRLARPLEHVAATAERFGAGELSARTGIERVPKRWVAEEVRDVAVAFDGMAERIERVVTDQRELLAAISHELRSPLGRARVALEIARERAGESTALRSLEDVERQMVEMDAILGDLLASARAGLADLRREPVDLGAWLAERAAVETTGAVEVTRADGEAPRVAIDPALFGRALHNVLANAWAHGHPKDVPLIVTVSADGEAARIAVRDRGPGFSEDVLPRAFEPFVTGTGTARSPGAHGIGLGLALVRRIVEAHGGTARASNVEVDGKREGAEIVLSLPLERAPD